MIKYEPGAKPPNGVETGERLQGRIDNKGRRGAGHPHRLLVVWHRGKVAHPGT